MQTISPSSKISATPRPPKPRYFGNAILLLALTFLAHNASIAEEQVVIVEGPASEVEMQFYLLLEDMRYSIDAATEGVAKSFNPESGAEIAVLVCSPLPDRRCKGSKAWEAWDLFLTWLYEGKLVGQVINDMKEVGIDPYLASEIGRFWCWDGSEPGCLLNRRSRFFSSSDVDRVLNDMIEWSECENNNLCGQAEVDAFLADALNPEQQAGRTTLPVLKKSTLKFDHDPEPGAGNSRSVRKKRKVRR